MASASRLAPFLCISFFLSGCAANDIMVKRQAEAEAKIEFLIQTSNKVEQRHNELAATQQIQDDRIKTLSGEIKQLMVENRDLRASGDELKARVAKLAQQSQTPKIEVVNQPSGVTTGKEAGPPAEYLKSFGLYSANNFLAAIESFESFLKNNPKSDYAANALYWIGECHYTLSDLPKAKEAFLKVYELYPKSYKAPDALLKLGYTLSALKEQEKAKGIFEKIITSYPSSPAAIKARERLNSR
ncbi:MAG: tol-pal system protein YbgF [Geobacteraceae bacterium GWB2_52_12]|nr:MAG: tol-pal system protein YbgF [Geobacteraceae bacterium GWB2_52_12]